MGCLKCEVRRTMKDGPGNTFFGREGLFDVGITLYSL